MSSSVRHCPWIVPFPVEATCQSGYSGECVCLPFSDCYRKTNREPPLFRSPLFDIRMNPTYPTVIQGRMSCSRFGGNGVPTYRAQSSFARRASAVFVAGQLQRRDHLEGFGHLGSTQWPAQVAGAYSFSFQASSLESLRDVQRTQNRPYVMPP